MKPPVALICISVISVAVALSSVRAQGTGVWYQKQIMWKYGADSGVWETTIASSNKSEQYKFGLLPLWAVEGGVVAMEIQVADPAHPDKNLLGPEDNSPHPFVIEIKELRRGIRRSPFGATRRFNLGQTNLVVKIKGARLGKGVGSGSTYCKDCDNIQEFTAEFAFEGK